MLPWKTKAKRCKRGMGKDMKWMFLIIFLTSGSFRAGVDTELFRFYTQEGCEETRQHFEELKRFNKTRINRNGLLVITECFSEKLVEGVE